MRVVVEAGSSGRKVRAVCGTPLPRGVDAITIGRLVLVRRRDGWVGRLRQHELVHVEQYEAHGVTGFLWRYLSEYVRLRRGGAAHQEAYRSISFEREAYDRS